MVRSEVEEWLYSIGLQHLFAYFEEDGFRTLNDVRLMRQSDIDAIVDRHGYMIILNEEIDRLNYPSEYGAVASSSSPAVGASAAYRATVERESSIVRASAAPSLHNETRESLIKKYQTVPSVGFVSKQLERRAKSKLNKTRGVSLAHVMQPRPATHVPNSGVEAYEAIYAHKRAASVAAAKHTADQLANASSLVDDVRREHELRMQRAKSGKRRRRLVHSLALFDFVRYFTRTANCD